MSLFPLERVPLDALLHALVLVTRLAIERARIYPWAFTKHHVMRSEGKGGGGEVHYVEHGHPHALLTSYVKTLLLI